MPFNISNFHNLGSKFNLGGVPFSISGGLLAAAVAIYFIARRDANVTHRSSPLRRKRAYVNQLSHCGEASCAMTDVNVKTVFRMVFGWA